MSKQIRMSNGLQKKTLLQHQETLDEDEAFLLRLCMVLGLTPDLMLKLTQGWRPERQSFWLAKMAEHDAAKRAKAAKELEEANKEEVKEAVEETKVEAVENVHDVTPDTL